MFVEEIPQFFEFLQDSLLLVLAIGSTCVFVGIFFGYLIATFRHGPFEAFYVVSTVIAQSIPDFLKTSPRRVYAIAYLAAKEAIRRRVILVTFLIFAMALLFGGWFINSGVDHPDQVYVNFVLFGTQLLILMLGLLISAFSLPEDIKNKTIFTVVTKPVRATEIILGRILGFTALGTALLVTMAVISLLFVWRGLSHTHEVRINPDKPNAVAQSVASFNDVLTPGKTSAGTRVSPNAIKELKTTLKNDHRHQLEYIRDVRPIDADPPDPRTVVKEEKIGDRQIAYYRVICQPFAGHTHQVSIEGEGENAIVKLGPAVGYFRARVPVYSERVVFYDRRGAINGIADRKGELKDETGRKTDQKGINVGKQWNYRGYLDGGTSLCKAEFEFDGFRPNRFSNNDVIPIELSLGAFRTHKGNMERRVRASIQFESLLGDDEAPANNFVSDPIVFETSEYQLQTLGISRSQPSRILDPDGNEVASGIYDIFDNFGENGKIKVIIRCEDPGQYIGVGLGDVYFRAEDNQYWLNFFKGYFGIWLQMLIVITLGVTFSTFLSTPVTMLATLCTIILGFVSPFIQNMLSPESAGGGPIESMVRLITQKNMEVQIEESFATTMMKQTDSVLVYCLQSLTHIAPNFGKLDFSNFLKYGYWIEGDRLLIATAMSFALCFGLYVLGYFCLKTREIAG